MLQTGRLKIVITAFFLFSFSAVNIIAAESAAFKEGARLYKASKFKQAVTALKRAVKQNPKDAKAQYLLGLASFGAGSYQG
ncbi:MAG: tetratricopeptide repeat protein, partial [Planctomycetota bacterium]